jgi:hypothetical protein
MPVTIRKFASSWNRGDANSARGEMDLRHGRAPILRAIQIDHYGGPEVIVRRECYLTRTRTGSAGTQQMCDTMSLLELFPRQRREPPVSLGESRGLNKERP